MANISPKVVFGMLFNIGAKKIDGIILDIYKMIVTVFLVIDKANQIRLFKETFFVANISLKIVFKMSFFPLSSADDNFLGRELW